jgi:hypothetical protein
VTKVKFVPAEATNEQLAKCGARRGVKGKTSCELPADHIVGRNHTPYREHNHTGRDRTGRWLSWSPDTQQVYDGRGEERELEQLVRQVPCPLCSARPRRSCRPGAMAHTSRYLDAAALGLVPPLPGWPWTG